MSFDLYFFYNAIHMFKPLHIHLSFARYFSQMAKKLLSGQKLADISNKTSRFFILIKTSRITPVPGALRLVLCDYCNSLEKEHRIIKHGNFYLFFKRMQRVYKVSKRIGNERQPKIISFWIKHIMITKIYPTKICIVNT